MPLPLPQIKVRIRNLAFGGAGVGEVLEQSDEASDLIGISAFVPFTGPGELVRAQVVERKNRYLVTRFLAVEQASPSRVTPPCSLFGTCGGCELQHLNYDGQLSAKLQMIRGALVAGNLSPEVLQTLRPIKASSAFHYRRRISLHVDSQGNIGFYRAQSRVVVPLEHCEIAEPALNAQLASLKHIGQDIKGLVSAIDLDADERGVITVLKCPYGLTPSQSQALQQTMRPFCQNVLIIAQGKEIGGFGRQILELPLNKTGSLKLSIPAGSFSQVNWRVNLELIDEAIRESNLTRPCSLLDLYSGAGNFSVPFAHAGAQVIAVESDERLANLARENVRRNRLDRNLEVKHCSVESFLKSQGGKNYDIVIADPPRSGLGPLAASVPKAKRLLLISCYLPSLVRDLKALQAQGWQTSLIQPYDMFAQTSYIEILAVLERDL